MIEPFSIKNTFSEMEKNSIERLEKERMIQLKALVLERVTNDFLRNSNTPSSKLNSENVSLYNQKY